LFFDKINLLKDFRVKIIPEEDRAHYSKITLDLEVNTSFGYVEIAAIAHRNDYDLSQHQKYSHEDLEIDGKIPRVIEPTFGIDRILFSLLDVNFKEDKDRHYISLPSFISPYDFAIFPLVNKDGVDEYAKTLYKDLKKYFIVYYEDKRSIGKRYMKADEIGIKYCITIDYQSLEDDTITIRDRDDRSQIRINRNKLKEFFENKIKV